ncbi:hypothetical protein SAMD00023353_3400160 [Rosellinia necatrix]|uniref:Uncharacterized protein n=1 Tax=Rosellinia necatrix TaxID=77044 RepID=A0A1W2TKY0_ROSNE|nr:hypothetical protein SAMD00023353_3400160 [Rosellinia necatrix]
MENTEPRRKRPRQSLSHHTKRLKPSPNNPLGRSAAQRQALLHVDFRSNEPLQGPPNHRPEDFEQPRLRKCPFRLDTINWKSATKLGDGYDGCAWKVDFGDAGPFVLKVFWDTQPPQTYYAYFAPQRECQNAAILQMVEAVLEERPVPLRYNHPETHAQAMANMLAFSVPQEEAQQRQAVGSPRTVLSHSPPTRKCYGWLDFDGDLIKSMPYRTKPQPRKRDKPPHSMSPGNTYHAIVYEYIPEEDNEPALIKAQLQFFHLIGFSFTCSPRIENWKGGRLIDGSDVVYPGGAAWNAQYYGSPLVAAALLGSLEEWEADSNPRTT